MSVDNLPLTPLPALVGMMSNDPRSRRAPPAVGADVLAYLLSGTLGRATLNSSRAQGIAYRVIFLEASPETPVRRYESTDAPIPRVPAPSWMASAPKCASRALRRAADEVIVDTSDVSRPRAASATSWRGSTAPSRSPSNWIQARLALDADHVVDALPEEPLLG